MSDTPKSNTPAFDMAKKYIDLSIELEVKIKTLRHALEKIRDHPDFQGIRNHETYFIAKRALEETEQL